MTEAADKPQIETEAELKQTILAFQHAAEELRFYKSQQWRVTNYALLVYAALAGAPALVANPDWINSARWVCVATAAAAAIWACTVLAKLNDALQKERTRMTKAHERLPVLWEIHEETHRVAALDVSTLLYMAVGAGLLLVFGIHALNTAT